MLAESLKARLALYAEKILVFERYTELSAKDYERERRAGVGSITFNLDLNSPLPSCEAVMKNKHSNRGLSRLLITFNLRYLLPVSSRRYWSSGGQNSQRRQLNVCAAGLLDVEKWDGVVLDINATCANLGDTVCS